MDEQDTFYREDQIYFGASLMLFNSNQDDFKSQGLSRHIQFGIIRDIPLNKSGKFATGVGLGMSFDKYKTNIILSGEGLYSLSNSNLEIADPLFFSVNSIELPLSIRWRSSTLSEYAFWRVYGGIAFQWNYRSITKQNSNFTQLSDEIQRFGTMANLVFGYNTWNFYLAYNLTTFFNSEKGELTSIPIKFKPFKIGLIFYFL